MKIKANIVNHNNSFFGEVEIKNNKFISIKKISSSTNLKYDYLLPSFVDSHTHGGYGLDFNLINSWTEKDFEKFRKNLFSEGVTNVAMTIVTTSVDSLISIANFYKKNDIDFIKSLHIEGPFISLLKKGAHNSKQIIAAQNNIIENIVSDLNGKKIIITSALEEHDNYKILSKFLSKDFFVSLGHSDASNIEAKKWLSKKYYDRYTHLFNAMSGFDHRNPGIVFTAFDQKKGWVEIIGDGIHVNDDVLKYTYKNIKPNRLILISDSLSLKGKPDGFFKLGELEAEKKGNICFIKNTNTIAGSSMKYLDLVKHFFGVTNCSLTDLVKITSYNYFKSIHLNNKYGYIGKNKIADFIILDKDLNLLSTYKDGIKIFEKKH